MLRGWVAYREWQIEVKTETAREATASGRLNLR
jgi:hypothetical protein